MARRFDSIRTERLVMRRWREPDREPYAALNADPEVMRYFPATLGRAASDASADRMEDLLARHGFGLWALEVAATAEFIGFTGLNPMPDGVSPATLVSDCPRPCVPQEPMAERGEVARPLGWRFLGEPEGDAPRGTFAPRVLALL